MADISRSIRVEASFEDRASVGVKNLARELENASRQTPVLANQFTTLSGATTVAGVSMANFQRQAGSLKVPALDPLTHGFAALSTQVGGSTTSLVSNLKAIAPVALAYAGLGTGITAVTGIIGESIREFRNAEVAAVRLEFAIRNSQRAYTADIAVINEWIQATSKSSIVNDEYVKSLTALAVTLGRNEEETRKVVKTALDIESALGVDARTAVLALTKSYEGQDFQLRRMLPNIREFTDAELRSGAAVDQAAKIIGPATEAMANTTDAQFRRIKIVLDEFEEDLGSALIAFLKFRNVIGSPIIFPGPQARERPSGAPVALGPELPLLGEFGPGGGAAGETNRLAAEQARFKKIREEEIASMEKFAEEQKLLAEDIAQIRKFLELQLQYLPGVAARGRPNVPGFVNVPGAPLPGIPGLAPIPEEDPLAKQLQDDFRLAGDLAEDFFSGMASGFGQSITHADTFFGVIQAGFENLIRSITDALVSAAIRQAGASIFSIFSGGSGGFVGEGPPPPGPSGTNLGLRALVRSGGLGREINIARSRGHIL